MLGGIGPRGDKSEEEIDFTAGLTDGAFIVVYHEKAKRMGVRICGVAGRELALTP